MAAPRNVTLGFVEETENWRLGRRYFPSKVGGKPAWLSMKDIPNCDDLKCKTCGKFCVFLLQIYCPIDELPSTCFHRTIFVFCCKNPTCYKHGESAAFAVFRSQLPRANEFYDYEPPEENNPLSVGVGAEQVTKTSAFGGEPSAPSADHASGSDGSLCSVCGCFGGKRCAKCHLTSYCCREHQIADWKAGHKQNCGLKGSDVAHSSSSASGSRKFLFPEFELVTEPEVYNKTENKETGHHTSQGQDSSTELGVDELQKMALGETKEDRQFAKFKKRIKHEPEQVIRYERGGNPLLISCEHKPHDIPPCSSCGSPRQFEFQVMPQLLIHLGVDSLEASIDWGTLLIYTCSKSCDQGPSYHEEFLWKQDVAESSKE